VSFENVQQYHEKIPLYSNIASGAQTFDAGTRGHYTAKNHNLRADVQTATNGIIHSGDPVRAKNPKHRNVSGQYFVRFATENPNYPSSARKKPVITTPNTMNGAATAYPPQPAYPHAVNGAASAYPPQYYGASYQHQMQAVNAMNGVQGMNAMNTMNGMNPMNPYGAMNANMNPAGNGMAVMNMNMNTMNGMMAPQCQPAPVPESVALNGYNVNFHPGYGIGVGVQPQPPPPMQMQMQMPMARMPPNHAVPAPPVALSTPSSSSTHTVPLAVSRLNSNHGQGHAPKSVVEAAQSSPKPMMVRIPRSDDRHPKPVGAGKQQFGLCPMFGSVKGCKWGADCFYKHNDPNSVPFCPDFSSPEGCYFGQNCFNRHQTFVFVKRGEPIPRFIRKESTESEGQEAALREE